MMNDDNQQNWNTLLQKLTSRTPDPSSKSADDVSNQLGLLFQGTTSAKSNGNSPDIKSFPGDNVIGEKDDLSNSRRSENLINSLIINYVDEISELQINNARNFEAEERNGRTMALNSKFICYSNQENALVIKSLKNLSLIKVIQDSKEKIVDLLFLEDTLLSYLAFIYQDGTVIIVNIEESQSKDQIKTKYLLQFNLGKTCEKAQLQWKDSKQLGVVVDKTLTLLTIQSDESDVETVDNAPQPASQNNIEFDFAVKDFSFSPSFPLVYLLLENNKVRIHNLESNSTVKEFRPHGQSETVVRLLTYKSLIRHEPIKSNAEGDKSYDHTWRDIFLTATQGFEIKVWDLSEWDESKKTYLCLETFQINQNNDKLDPIPLIKRFIFYDAGLNFIFVGFKTNGDKGVCLNALHIDQFYCGYSDLYDQVKKTKRFFNSIQTIWFKKNDVSDFSVLNFGDDEMEFYFKENTYPQMNDVEPASTRTQDGSYACNSKSILSFFVHNDNNISVFKVLGDKLYPFALVEELDKLTQAEQLENQPVNFKSENNETNHPPDISVLSPFIKDLLDQNKKTQGKETDPKNAKVSSEGKIDNFKKSGQSDAPSTKKDQNETASPEPSKHHAHSRKSKGGKDKDMDSHEHGKHKGNQPVKVVTRESQKSVTSMQQGVKSVESLEKDSQFQSIEKGIEKKFQDFMDKIPQLLTAKFNKIEEVIDSKVNERVSKLQMDLIGGALSKEIDDKMQREFSHAFEKTVTPCLEKYLAKVFEQVCASFEKGHKYYIDKLNIEQAKSAQVKETMNEVVKSFVQISNSLTEGYANSQSNFSRMETSIQDKQGQLLRLIEQMNEILQKQQDIQKQIDTIEKNMQDLSTQHQNEIEMFRETANRYLDRFNEISSGSYAPGMENATKMTERIKKEAPYQQNYYGMYPQGTNQFYNPAKNAKDKGPHPLNDQLVYLQNLMSGRPMDLSGGLMPRGPPISLPGMNSPGSSQMFGTNPYGQNFDYYNPYQKAKNPNLAIPNFGNMTQHQNQQQPIIPPNLQHFYNPNQGNQQAPGNLPPEVQAFYQNLGELLKMQNKDKEEDKDKERTFNSNTQENSPFIPNYMGQEKKFFDLAQAAQGAGGNTSQGSLNSQRTLSQIENPQQINNNVPNTPSQSNQQDKDSGSSKNSNSLPPGMQTPTQTQNQPNFVQTLYQNLPQNLQQQLTQNQNLNAPKMGPNFNQNLPQQNAGQNQNIQNPIFNPNLYFQNPQPQQNFGNFNNGPYGLPPSMTNPQIKVSKNTSSVDISQIPLVNSMFKTPSRDAVEETTSQDGSTNN